MVCVYASHEHSAIAMRSGLLLVEKDKKWFCTNLRKNTEFRWAPSLFFTRP